MSDLMDICAHEARFAAFIAPYLERAEPMLILKAAHTREVLAHARAILASGEAALAPQAARAALLAAQYHDIARFPQFVRWQTFSDADSVNHGQLGCRMLRREHLLDMEAPAVRRLARIAVCLHNRRALPRGLCGAARLVTEVVRDADKLDIFRIMAQFLTGQKTVGDVVMRVRNVPDRYSPHIAALVAAGRVPPYAELVYVNDFRLLLGAWQWDLRFACSRRALAASGHLEAVLAGLPADPGLQPALAALTRAGADSPAPGSA